MLADYLRLITGDLQRVGLQGPDKEAPTSHRIPRINNEPSRPTEGVRFCLSRRSAPLYRENLFELNRNGDHSGSQLASSKLVVTQDDLHLIGSSVNQLVLCFDQAAFDKFLATARVKANKAEKHRHKTRATGAQYILVASSSHGNLSSHRRRAASVSNDGPISTSAWSRIYHPVGKVRTF